jgi:hypothetical protein
LALVREKYSGPVTVRFGPTLAAEHPASEDGVNRPSRHVAAVDVDCGIVESCPHPRRIASDGSARRISASSCSWMAVSTCGMRRAPRACLMTLVDDAPADARAARGRGNDLGGGRFLRRWIEAYGVPLARIGKTSMGVPNVEEQVTGAVPLTQFGRMCASLGIDIIAASSPQGQRTG